MKKILFIIMIICFMPAFAIADAVDDGLPSDTPAGVKESARQVIGLGVENRGVVNMTRTMLENNYTEKQMLAAHEILMEAQRQGQDTGPIMNKFNESVANKEKASRGIKAMETVRSNYETAGNLAGKMTQDKTQAKTMTLEMAECMNAGITTKNMEQISTMLKTGAKDMKTEDAQAYNMGALGAVRQMAGSGADSGSVTRVMKNAVEKGYTARDMEKLGNAFTQQVKNASSATALAKSFAEAVKNGARSDNLANYIQKGYGSGSGKEETDTGFGSGGFGSGSGGASGSGMGGGGKGRR